jgi:chemotaxis response regulator CheB
MNHNRKVQTDGIKIHPHSPAIDTDFPVVCIGLSAGGIDPLQTIFRGISPRTGMAFVVIHHLREGNVSHLPEILSRCTLMPVHLVKAAIPFEPNHVYVIDPGQEIGLTDGLFTSQPRTKKHGWTNVISLFIASLTGSRHPGIAVILSGMDEDGTAALKQFKQHGGVTIVQAPETAGSRGMPTAAIMSGAVDYILDPEAIPGQLQQIAKSLQPETNVHR